MFLDLNDPNLTLNKVSKVIPKYVRGVSPNKCKAILDSCFDIIREHLMYADGNKFVVTNLGSLKTKTRKVHVKKKDEEQGVIITKRTVTLKLSKNMKDELNSTDEE